MRCLGLTPAHGRQAGQLCSRRRRPAMRPWRLGSMPAHGRLAGQPCSGRRQPAMRPWRLGITPAHGRQPGRPGSGRRRPVLRPWRLGIKPAHGCQAGQPSSGRRQPAVQLRRRLRQPVSSRRRRRSWQAVGGQLLWDLVADRQGRPPRPVRLWCRRAEACKSSRRTCAPSVATLASPLTPLRS